MVSPVATNCASCGKEGGDRLKACTACKLVKYCNRDCQKAHRSQHKKACRKRVAELHEEALFSEPPPPEDCPICFLPLPPEVAFWSCCGKTICGGCIIGILEEKMPSGKPISSKKMREAGTCPYCRQVFSRDFGVEVKQLYKLACNGNAGALHKLGVYHMSGVGGELGGTCSWLKFGDRDMVHVPRDWTKANEYFLKAGELGHAGAYTILGDCYCTGGLGVSDMKKAKHYYELAAMGGDEDARAKLGGIEWEAGNCRRAMKHFIVAAKSGHKDSLDNVRKGLMNGLCVKDEYEQALRGYQNWQDGIKSDLREKAKRCKM